MQTHLLIATNHGLVACERQGEAWKEVRRSLTERRLTCVIARQGVVLAGTVDGIYRSDDLGKTWQDASQGLGIRHVRWLAYHPDISDFELAGTEPAGIFISRDGAATWQECPEVGQLRDRYGWSLPYSPEAGCVRGFAVHGRRAYAAVEDGCVLVSDDGPQTWSLAEGSRGRPDHRPPPGYAHSDVHSIEVHPRDALSRPSPDLVYAPTGGGFYRSMDGGTTWTNRYPHSYCRAVWVDPEDPEHMVLGPADFVDRGGRIEESHDGGQTWKLASQGLEIPWRDYMVERFAQSGDQLLAVLSNGDLCSAPIATLHWQRLLPNVGGVAAVATLEA